MSEPPIKTPHEWRASTLGHGEWQCIHCLATNREIAVIGDPNHCPEAHRGKFPATTEMEARLTQALVEQNELLRSAMQIAKREGVEGHVASTNWDAYYNRVAVSLKRHHDTVNQARAALAEVQARGDASTPPEADEGTGHE